MGHSAWNKHIYRHTNSRRWRTRILAIQPRHHNSLFAALCETTLFLSSYRLFASEVTALWRFTNMWTIFYYKQLLLL